MQRPRIIATGAIIERTRGLIAQDQVAGDEYRSFLKRTDTIFKMKLLSYDDGHVPVSSIFLPQPAPTAPVIALPPSVAAALQAQSDTTPLSFLPTAGSFEPAPIKSGNAGKPHFGMMTEALSFKQKGFEAIELAKAGLARLQALALAWHLVADDQKPKYVDRALKEMTAICVLPDWGRDQFLATATFMQALAIGYDWLHPQIPVAQRDTIRQTLIDKGVVPALAAFSSNPRPNWLRLSNNWNIVCNASLIITALAIGPDTPDPRVARMRDLALEAIKVGLGLFDADGSWKLEGPGYWHLAAEHLTYLLAALETVDGDTAGLSNSPGIANTGHYRCYMSGPTTALFNFGDSEEKRPGLWWMRWMGSRYGQPHYHEMAEDRTGKTGAAEEIHPMDLLWRRPTPSATAQASTDFLPTAQVFCETAILRGAWGDATAAYVGIKGGETSGRRSHSDLDLGHFIYEVGGVRWALDLEPDAYTECYLEPPRRYNYYRTNTHGHNTLVINGNNQAFAPFDGTTPAVAARFSSLEYLPQATAITIDLSNAYPAAGSVKRTFSLAANGNLTIADDIDPRGGLSDVTWSMHTKSLVHCEGRTARLTQSYGVAHEAIVLYVSLHGVDGARFECVDAGAPVPYAACSPKESDNPGIKRLMIKLGPVRIATQLAVRFSLYPS